MTAARRRPPALALALAALTCALGWAPQRARAQPRTGFDHLLHARDVFTATAHDVPCARCHPMARGELRGRPGHAACFGDCHGPAPTRADAARALAQARSPATPSPQATDRRLATCRVCHATAELAVARPQPAYPPYLLDREWGLQLSHARHREAGCLRCHGVPAAPRTSAAGATGPAPRKLEPHQRCRGCHTGAATAGPLAFAMDACPSCHFAAVGPRSAPTLARARTPVTRAFSHASHQARAPRPAQGASASCLPCHRQVTQDHEPGEVPAPSAETCAESGCHDGKAAFPITERCTQCHRDPPESVFAVPRPTARFSHQQHAEAQAAVGCVGCHRLRPDNPAALQAPGHAACASCHGKDFGSPSPLTCGACHVTTEPWRHLYADRLPTDGTELGSRMDHARHALPCQRCHTLDTSTRQLRLPRDHSACTGTGCHQPAGGPAPALAQCESCHAAQLVSARQQARQRAPWTVRRTFEHRQHQLDQRGAPAACTSCHLSLAGPLETLPTPPKRTCEPCHDGSRAFAVTGTSCARCHGGQP